MYKGGILNASYLCLTISFEEKSVNVGTFKTFCHVSVRRGNTVTANGRWGQSGFFRT